MVLSKKSSVSYTYSREGNEREGGLLPFSKNFPDQVEQKMSEISIKAVEDLDEVDEIILITNCSTKLH